MLFPKYSPPKGEVSPNKIKSYIFLLELWKGERDTKEDHNPCESGMFKFFFSLWCFLSNDTTNELYRLEDGKDEMFAL